mmetsp:Transcript_29443/g.68358  ORF Transcript_29443/g.68358 Transcript_29443/m.68358 type:complete len:281 (-) Transcript_29443:152-994(-)
MARPQGHVDERPAAHLLDLGVDEVVAQAAEHRVDAHADDGGDLWDRHLRRTQQDALRAALGPKQQHDRVEGFGHHRLRTGSTFDLDEVEEDLGEGAVLRILPHPLVLKQFADRTHGLDRNGVDLRVSRKHVRCYGHVLVAQAEGQLEERARQRVVEALAGRTAHGKETRDRRADGRVHEQCGPEAGALGRLAAVLLAEREHHQIMGVQWLKVAQHIAHVLGGGEQVLGTSRDPVVGRRLGQGRRGHLPRENLAIPLLLLLGPCRGVGRVTIAHRACRVPV